MARQYINDNGSFQRQARLWTGQCSGACFCLLQQCMQGNLIKYFNGCCMQACISVQCPRLPEVA